MSWNGSGTFTATFELLQGNSLRLDLLNLKGEVLATAATGDLLSGILVGLMPNTEAISFTGSDDMVTAAQGDDPDFQGRPVLVLSADDLPPGDYILQVSHGTLDTVVLATPPAGATTDGSITLRRLAGWTASCRADSPGGAWAERFGSFVGHSFEPIRSRVHKRSQLPPVVACGSDARDQRRTANNHAANERPAAVLPVAPERAGRTGKGS
jgi:hypothetical protein